VVTSLAFLAGLVATIGAFLAVSGGRLAPVDPSRGRPLSERLRVEPPSAGRAGAIALVTLVVLLVTRWPVAAIGAGCAVAFFTSRGLRRRVGDAEKAEALTVWAEMLRDATGTPRGIEGVLVATANGAPEPLRPAVQRLARRLPYEPLDTALEGLADDLDHPVGDLMVTALRLSARAGGRQIRAVLDDLATMAREEARMHRRVEVARARPRADMRSVLAVMSIFVTVLSIIGRRYLEPYGTVQGQFVLVVVLAVWSLGVWGMTRLGRGRPTERFLAAAVGQDVNVAVRPDAGGTS
jgi:Flp pilus assembly protein TadB